MDATVKAQLPGDLARSLERIGCTEPGQAVTLHGRWDKNSRYTVRWVKESERNTNNVETHYSFAPPNNLNAVWLIVDYSYRGDTPTRLTSCWSNQPAPHPNGNDEPGIPNTTTYVAATRGKSLCFSSNEFASWPDDPQWTVLPRWLDNSLTADEAQTAAARRRHWAVDNVRPIRCFVYTGMTVLACAALRQLGRKYLSPDRLKHALVGTALVGAAIGLYRARRPQIFTTLDKDLHAIGQDRGSAGVRFRGTTWAPLSDHDMWRQIPL